MSSGRISLFGALAVLLGLLWYVTRPQPLVIQGEVSTDRYDISARVSGRINQLNAAVGDTVKKGQVIAVLDNPQLMAQLATQKAALAVAKADLVRVESVRPENVDAAQAQLAAAAADLKLQEQTYDRQAELARSGHTSVANLDTATRNRDAALKKRDEAAAQLKLTKEGASPEEKALSVAKVEQAEAAVKATEADVAELQIKSPIEGLVTTRAAELGENFSVGAPIMSIIDMSNLWLTFNIREDLLKGMQVGNEYTITSPALGTNNTFKARVTVMNVQGQFAQWRSTRATGDFDLRTFEVRGVPTTRVEALRPGMSVIAKGS